MDGELDNETRTAVSEELGILRQEIETARPPWDVKNSVAAREDRVGGLAEA